MQELVSVIVPIFNGEKYLSECLESIINQTYKNIDICLIDDGSTDRTEVICRRYSANDKRIRYIKTENHGCSAARNYGITASRGGYILFVDCDDFIHPNTIECTLECLKKHNADLVQFDFEYFNDNKEWNDLYNIRDHIELVYTNTQALERMLNPESRKDTRFTDLRMSCGCIWNKLCKREIVEKFLYPVGKRYEDTAVSHHYLYGSKICVFTNDIYYYYRINQNGFLKTSTWKNRLEKLEALYDRIELVELENLYNLIGFAVEDYLGNLMYIYRDMLNHEYDITIAKWLIWQSRRLSDKYSNYITRSVKTKITFFNISPKLYFKVASIVKKNAR